MPHTPEQRDKAGICGARKKDGSICRAFAGQGTDHKGIGRCKYHGGNTPSHKQHAISAEAKRNMVKLGAPVKGIDPQQALVALLSATAGHVQWLHIQIGGMDDVSTPENRVLVDMYDGERDRLARIAKACSDVGVQEREINLMEKQAALFASVVERALVDAGLTTDQRQAIHVEVARQLDASVVRTDDLKGSLYVNG